MDEKHSSLAWRGKAENPQDEVQACLERTFRHLHLETQAGMHACRLRRRDPDNDFRGGFVLVSHVFEQSFALMSLLYEPKTGSIAHGPLKQKPQRVEQVKDKTGRD